MDGERFQENISNYKSIGKLNIGRPTCSWKDQQTLDEGTDQ